MNLTFLKIFLSRNDVKIIIICTVTGGILQVVAKQYLESHPEFLKDVPVTKKNDKTRRFFSPRGGALIEIIGISGVKIIVKLVASKGVIYGIVTGIGSAALSKIPLTAVSNYLQEGLPQNLPHLEKRKYILVGGEKLYLDQCDQSLEYLFKVLKDETLPFKEKEEPARSILTKYLSVKTPAQKAGCVLCIVMMLFLLSTLNTAGFYALLKSVIKAIKEGKISKPLGRAIIRRLRKKSIPIDPELIDSVQD